MYGVVELHMSGQEGKCSDALTLSARRPRPTLAFMSAHRVLQKRYTVDVNNLQV